MNKTYTVIDPITAEVRLGFKLSGEQTLTPPIKGHYIAFPYSEIDNIIDALRYAKEQHDDTV